MLPIYNQKNTPLRSFKNNLVVSAGLEPATFSLGRNCSIQLSYATNN